MKLYIIQRLAHLNAKQFSSVLLEYHVLLGLRHCLLMGSI